MSGKPAGTSTSSPAATSCTAPDAASLRSGRRLEYLTLGWNLLEGVASVGVGLLAGSTALVGFGADSFVESASGGILLWRLQDGEDHEHREELALKLVGVSFFLLAAYVAFEAGRSLLLRRAARGSVDRQSSSRALSLVVMPWLARKKRAGGRGAWTAGPC